MRVVIAGGHGQIAQQLEKVLDDRGHQPVGIVRNPDHTADLERLGAEAVVLDLEQAGVDELAAVVAGADAVVFAAGGGPDSGIARKETVDKGAAILLAQAAEQAGVRRYVMLSSMGTDRVEVGAEPDPDDVFAVYLRAKRAADDDLKARDLDWTVVHPGRLTDEDATGRVEVGRLSRGDVTRADVALVLAEVLTTPGTVGKDFDLVGGSTSVPVALASL
ncbi:MAG: SDR family oxidoreductase [Nocardioidaceae bacterium]